MEEPRNTAVEARRHPDRRSKGVIHKSEVLPSDVQRLTVDVLRFKVFKGLGHRTQVLDYVRTLSRRREDGREDDPEMKPGLAGAT